MTSTRGEVCRDIVENLDLYNIGLHGPDILFYHDALVRNRVDGLDLRLSRGKRGRAEDREGEEDALLHARPPPISA